MQEDLAHLIFQAVAGVERCDAEVIECHLVMLPRTTHDIGGRGGGAIRGGGN
jgi:hypothetical protein